MTKKKTKSSFVGIKVTAEQAALLARLQQTLHSATKTEVLLRGLDLLAKSHSLDSTFTEGVPLRDTKVVSQIATSLQLARLEAEALQYISTLQQTRNKTEEVMRQMVQELAKIDQVVDRYRGDKSALIQILLDIQRENNWLPKDALLWVSQKLDIPLSQIYHIATFYKAFSLVPKGRHSCLVCLGTACQVRGAPRLLDKAITALKIKPGETSRDMRFSLDTVNCVGCCAIGPVMVVDDVYYGNPSTKEIREVAAACE